MYHALLTNRYLTSRVIPLIAVAAVALCVALVIIVVSVMTGFLDMVKASGKKLMGDVVIAYPVSGIPHYQRLIERITALPDVVAATPVVDTWGLMRMPYPEGPEKDVQYVQIWGIEPESFSDVTGFEETLHWPAKNRENPAQRVLTPEQRTMLLRDVVDSHWQSILAALDEAQRFDLLKRFWNLRNDDPQSVPRDEVIQQRVRELAPEQWNEILYALSWDEEVLRAVMTDEQWNALLGHDPRLVNDAQLLEDGRTLTRNGEAAIVLGMHISEGNERQRDGTYVARLGFWMPRFDVTIMTLPVVGGGFIDPKEVRFPIANEFASGVYLIDDTRVMAPLKKVQEMMHLHEAKRVDSEDPTQVIGVDPARATMILIRAREGTTPQQLQPMIEAAYLDFETEMLAELVPPPPRRVVSINTWEQQQSQFIGPIEKEREMMRTLFSLVYIVCAGLVLAIFWAIVYEKTRDIGILRSVGASRIGISWIFLRYGLVVGVLGAVVGLGLGYLVIRNINSIHEALSSPPRAVYIVVLLLAAVSLVITIIKSASGNLLPVVLGGLITAALMIVGSLALWLYNIGGFIMWDPKVYYFTHIPNELDLESAIITMIGAVVFSLIGAFVPAAKAADTDPVRALRYE
jgi:lipoprotein-releasing system permease protein